MLMLFYLAVFLTYNCDLRKFSSVFSVSCEVWCGCECCLLCLLPSHVCLFSSWLATGLLCPCLGWHMTHDNGLSPFGLICCYAMSPVKLTQSPLVIQPPFAWQQGLLTYILSWAFQLALVGLRCLRVPQSWRVGWLLRPDVV